VSGTADILPYFAESVDRFLADWRDRHRQTDGTVPQVMDLWREMAGMGWLTAPLPERLGGIGTAEATLALMRAAGYHLVSTPFATAVAGGGALFPDTGGDEQLKAIARGELRIAMCLPAGSPATAQAAHGSDGYMLQIPPSPIPDAATATHICIEASIIDVGPALFLLPVAAAGLHLTGRETPSGTRFGEVSAENLAVPPGSLLVSGNAAGARAAAVRSAVVAALCAESVGVMRRMLDFTVAYTRDRKQFGAPLATFQALRHRMADMLTEVEVAEAAAWRACMAGCPADVVRMKQRIDRALRHVAHESVQLHGGIGTTRELELSACFRRAQALMRDYRAFAPPEDRPRIPAIPTRSEADERADDIAFRRQIRDFLDRALTPDLRARAQRQTGIFAEPELAQQWHRTLFAQGWIAPSWPKEHGGPGWDSRQRRIFDEECARADTPLLPAMGLQMCGPVLMRFGTDKQKRFFLPRILSGEHRWCQGYSEPNAGSDLASLQCRMTRSGDRYVINGTKIWTTYAHAADWIFMLTRTDPSAKPQKGISFVLVPMTSPGISVAPIISMSGDHEVNQLFFDNVEIPLENLVGAENDGWTVAKYLLEFERGGGSVSARVVRVIESIVRLLPGRDPLDPALDDRLQTLLTEVGIVEWTQRRLFGDRAPGESVGNMGASILKLKATELYQAACELHLDAVTDRTRFDEARLRELGWEDHAELYRFSMTRYMNSRAMSIFGGTSEIQRTILAREGLGL
jgi:alkylation response protein AidB-like acyl-CoA dehydrogenase